MPSKLILDPAEPGMAEVLKGMKPGQSITLSEVEVTVDSNSPELFEATVDSISMEGGKEEEDESTTDEETVSKDEIPPASNSASGGFDMGGRP
jgi:hypothetical protein